MPSGAGHGGIALQGRSHIAVYPTMGVSASFRRPHQRPVLAVWLMRHSNENAMESGQVNPGLRYQLGKPCHKVQWLENYEGSTGPKAFAAAKALAALMGWASLMGPAFSVRCL